MERRSVRDVTRKEWLTSLGAGGAGVVNGAGLMVLATPGFLGINSFWELYATSCMLGAVAFPPLVVSLTNAISWSVIAMTSRYHPLASFLADLVREYGLASVTTPLGIAVGLVLWMIFGVFVGPHLLIAVGRGGPLTFPHLGLDVFVGYLVYGLSLGGFYGLVVQVPDVRRRVVRSLRPSAGDQHPR